MKSILALILAAAPAAAHLAVPFEVRGPQGARYSVAASFQDDPDPALTKVRVGFLPASGSAVSDVFGFYQHNGFEILRASFTFNSAVYDCDPVRVDIYEPLWHYKTRCRPTFTLNTMSSACDSACLEVAETLDASLPPRAFPNPFRPSGDETHIHLINLPPNARVRILSASGRLIYEGETGPGGGFNWNTHDRSGRQAGSGVYQVISGRKRLRIAIQR